MHYFFCRALPPSGECHRNLQTYFFVVELSSVNKPTKLDCHGNVPWVIKN